MPIDRERGERAIEEFLRAMGQDPADPDLAGTGSRVAEAWERDILAGQGVDAGSVLADESFPAPGSGDSSGLVVIRGVLVTTMCPHHLLPAVGTATVAYVPGARLTGLGTLVRLVDALSRRLTLQERIGDGVVSLLESVLQARGAACVLRLKHACLAARGERSDAIIETISTRGVLAPTGTHAAMLVSLLGGERG